ncbi:MAG: glycosyltransferase family 39 protein [Chloroflexi bacterium]|nr:glycosyltransferase family 39 protein [Chloroflexota bacterium]
MGPKHGEWLALGAILVVAAALRLPALGTVPQGWHYDEAVQGIFAREILQGARPVFFVAFTGQEPLYMYFAATIMAVAGDEGALTVRLASALAGLGTVVGVFLLIRELWGRNVALLSAAFMALSFWHTVGSRNGYRTITLPLLEVFALFLLVAALRRGAWWHYLLAGLVLGGTAYTYISARALPVALLGAGVWWLWARGKPHPSQTRGLALTLASALAAATPLLLHFLVHPDDFWGRMESVSFLNPAQNEGQALATLLDGIGRTLAMFTFAGDPLWRFNLPLRPIFVGPLALLFYLGLARILWGVWRREANTSFAAIVGAVMLLPMVLSAEAMPYTQRAVGIMPFVFVLPALGLLVAARWIAGAGTGWPRGAAPTEPPAGLRVRAWAAGALVAGVLILEGALTARDYFGEYVQSFAGQVDTDADLAAAARYLRVHPPPPDSEVIVSSHDYQAPVFAHLAPAVYPRLRWIDARYSLVFETATGRDSYYVLPWSALPDQRERFFPEESIVARESFANGVDRFLVARLGPEQVARLASRLLDDPALEPLGVRLEDRVDLIAYDLSRLAAPGERLPLSLLWRVRGGPDSRRLFFYSHLLDPAGRSWGQGDADGYPAAQWRPGDLVLTRADIALQPAAGPGLYRVRLGLYDADSLERVPVAGKADDGVDLGQVKVWPRDAPGPEEIPDRLNRDFDDGISLLGMGLREERQQDRIDLTVDLYWRANRKPSQDYTVFVQALDSAGALRAQSDSVPLEGRYPTSNWEPNELVVDRHSLRLIPGVEHRLIAGLYHLPDGRRLSLKAGGDHVELGLVSR